MAETDELTLADALDDIGLPQILDEAAVERLLEQVAGLSGSDHRFAVDACLDALAPLGDARPVLEVRPGGWVIDTTATAVRASLTAAVMTGVLWAGGFDQLPAYVLPAVLPLLVDVEQVKLNRRERKLLAVLRSNVATSAGHAVNSDVLYGRLPAPVQAEVSSLDFADFVDRLVAAGEADDAGLDDVTLRTSPTWIRISFT